MNQQRAPWLLGLAAAAAMIFSRAAPVPPATSLLNAPATSPAAASPTRGAVSNSAAPANPWGPYIHLYEQFFGSQPPARRAINDIRGTWGENKINVRVSAAAGFTTRDSLHDIAAHARKARYDLDFLVALVPDPFTSRLPSNFDLTLAGLQMGLTREHFIPDRRWTPWRPADVARDDGEVGAPEQTAGIMLFRTLEQDGGQAQVSQCLLAVFLIGETPQGGIHRQAFRQAVSFISGLRQEFGTLANPSACRPAAADLGNRARPFEEVRVLGPSFSGSGESLRTAMGEWPKVSFRLVTGSASATELRQYFPNGSRVTFSRTVVPDDQVEEAAYSLLRSRLGWDLRYAALLTEDNTAYGQGFDPGTPPPKGEPDRPQITLLFPSGLAAIRNAWEEAGPGRGADRASGSAQAAALGKQKAALDVSLADPGTPVEGVRELSPLTSRIEEMAMSNLLHTISRYGIRYVGIVATDVKDEIFLAEQIRRWAPDVILFLFESNLIYVHPHSNPTMFGSLAITSFPLLNKGLMPLPAQEQRPFVQFGSEVQEGIFRATQCLLEAEVEPPAVWIAATGSDTMSPLAMLPVRDPAFMDPCRKAELSPPSVKKIILFPERNDLQLLFLVSGLCALAYWLSNHAYLQRIVAAPDGGAAFGPATRTRIMLVLGESVLCVMGAGLVALALVPLNDSASFHEWAGPVSLHYLLLLITCAAFALLLIWLAKQVLRVMKHPQGLMHPRIHRAVAVAVMAAVLGGCLLYATMGAWLRDSWSLGEPGFFYLRARRFANGLSPFVSLGWLGGAFFLWISVELKRQQLRERHEVDWPLQETEPALNGCSREAATIKRLLTGIWPGSWGLLLVLAVAILPTAFLLWQTVQPLADPRWYGRLFVSVVLLAIILSVASFYRFVKTWLLLRRILGRLEHCRCRKSFAAISSIVQWNAMRSFVWYAPSFRSLAQTLHRLEELGRRFRPALSEDAARALATAFRAEAEGRFGDEAAARRELVRILDQSARELARADFFPGVQELSALRVVGYLRHVFGQMRYALIGAMVPALFVIFALNNYTFVPSRYMLLLVWAALLTASAMSLVIFVQMDRDVALSEIGNTPPGKVTVDRAFLSNIFAYAILPLLALISSQIPEVGQLLGHWLDPLARLLEVG
jgi:hypothetical protein